ncbi:MAG: carbon-nitrogen hydrolase family protein [Actinobacteria bacterium]|nr:carbon-nitrogen hydrolase family protein [Actinomycetota bacterium]
MLVGVAQIEPRLGEVERNLEACLGRVEEAAAAGCELLVLPECALTGYVFDSPEEAAGVALEVPGAETEALVAACERLGLYAVCGLLERGADGLRNCAVLTGPGGLVGRYWKSHLPYLGVDRFVVAGDGPFEPFDTPFGRIGIEICYDLRFPEVTRALALAGADLVAHPTNWPLAARTNADFMTRSRALENRLFLLTANRVGRERAAEFCGWSQIVDPMGERLVEADEASEVLLLAEIDLEKARRKDIIPKPGEYEMHLFDDRRPELYGSLVAEASVIRQR